MRFSPFKTGKVMGRMKQIRNDIEPGQFLRKATIAAPGRENEIEVFQDSDHGEGFEEGYKGRDRMPGKQSMGRKKALLNLESNIILSDMVYGQYIYLENSGETNDDYFMEIEELNNKGIDAFGESNWKQGMTLIRGDYFEAYIQGKIEKVLQNNNLLGGNNMMYIEDAIDLEVASERVIEEYDFKLIQTGSHRFYGSAKGRDRMPGREAEVEDKYLLITEHHGEEAERLLEEDDSLAMDELRMEESYGSGDIIDYEPWDSADDIIIDNGEYIYYGYQIGQDYMVGLAKRLN